MGLAGFHTLDSVAKELGVEYKALYARVIRGHISTNRFGKIHLVSQEELDRIKRELKFNKRKPRPPTPRALFLTKYRKTYSCWRSMMSRCHNPKYGGWDTHGGRGITVCDRWKVFENFLEDMGERPPGLTLERKNNDGNYEPSNCRWATWSDQNKNKRPWGSVSGRKPSC